MTVLSSPDVLEHLTGSYQLDPVHTRLGFAARYALVTRSTGGLLHSRGDWTSTQATPRIAASLS